MTTLTPETIRIRYRALPDDIREVYDSTQATERIAFITQKHNLRVDEAGELMDEVAKVMLGITHPDQLTKSVKTVLKVSDEKAADIVKDINEIVFLPIRESLKHMHRQPQKTAPPATTTARAPEKTSPTNEPVPDRETILRDIEQSPSETPMPKTAPQSPLAASPDTTSSSVATQAPNRPLSESPHTNPVPNSSTPQTPPAPTQPATKETIPPTNSIADTKLTQQVQTDTNSVDVSAPPATAGPSTPTKKTYSVDPYREPIE